MKFKDVIMQTVKTILRLKTWAYQNWFNENHKTTSAAPFPTPQAKNKDYVDWQNNPLFVSEKDKFKHLQSEVQTELGVMQDQWWQRKAEQVGIVKTCMPPESSSTP